MLAAVGVMARGRIGKRRRRRNRHVYDGDSGGEGLMDQSRVKGSGGEAGRLKPIRKEDWGFGLAG